MSFPIKDIGILAVGWILLLLWLLLYLKSKKYDSLFEHIEEKEFPLKELYSTGYAFMEQMHYSYKSKRDRRLRQRLEILYGKKYAEFYLRVTYAQQASIAMLLILLAFPLYGLSGEAGVLLVMLLFAGLAVYYYGTLADKKIQKRSDEMLGSFSEAIAKLALLTNAGMILKEAWVQVAKTGQGVLYQEMQQAVWEMENGVSEAEAIRRFGARCVIPEVKKFSGTVIQGLAKGNRELASMLESQSQEVWNARKQMIHRQGEKAASKLLLPIMMMFIGILIMVIVPIFTNLGM